MQGLLGIPEGMNFTTEYHKSLSIDKQRLVIPGDLFTEQSAYKSCAEGNATYMFLQRSSFLRIRVLRNCKAIELMGDCCTSSLSCQYSQRPCRRKLHRAQGQADTAEFDSVEASPGPRGKGSTQLIYAVASGRRSTSESNKL